MLSGRYNLLNTVYLSSRYVRYLCLPEMHQFNNF